MTRIPKTTEAEFAGKEEMVQAIVAVLDRTFAAGERPQALENVAEFFRVLDRAKTLRSNLAEKYKTAEQRIVIARAIEGSLGVRSAALASREVPTLDLKTKNVMGIIVPKIDAKSVRKKLEDRGYGVITTSARIDEAAEAYEALVEDIVVAAEIETTMRRLIEEIEKVKRRVNALEYRVIPELKATEAFIRQRLEEMERDNFMRLKRFKAM